VSEDYDLTYLRDAILISSIIILSFLSKSYSYAQSDIVIKSEIQNQIENELVDQSNKIPGQAVVLIYSDTSWSGSVLDSSDDSATRDGTGNSKILIQCTNNAIYSLTMQKQTDFGYLTVVIIQDGKILDSKSTSANYGVVSLAGNCA